MSPNIVTSLRWVARIAGLLVLLIVLAIAIGEGYPNPFTYTMTSYEQIMSLSLLVMLVGILLSWKWEGMGGGLLVVGYVTFLTVESVSRHALALFSPSFGFLDLFLLLGLINLAVWWLMKRSHTRQRNPISNTAAGV
jgi:hypothetical protein